MQDAPCWRVDGLCLVYLMPMILLDQDQGRRSADGNIAMSLGGDRWNGGCVKWDTHNAV